MNFTHIKRKQILQICFREPFPCWLHVFVMLFCYVVSEFALFVSITPTPKFLSLLFGFLYALVFM